MKELFPRYLDLPLLLLLTGTITPVAIMILAADPAGYQLPIFDWVSNFWYIAFSLAATEAVVRNIFIRPLEKIHLDIKNQHLQFIVRNIMLGIILIACNWSPGLDDFNQALRYLTVRLGVTLLFLGALVLLVAHRRMKSL